ncbi:hypothetical protein DBV15_08810 [Temnothorax longispinosus]|uniref:Uncharacterized protein n=1 Tax=Temnothorax longispinosus TaxID=300112 RepID=A0A4S2KB33_9HYME|nr:hypothetical protein DBV15_08810 [Temnothorax longispinosus]
MMRQRQRDIIAFQRPGKWKLYLCIQERRGNLSDQSQTFAHRIVSIVDAIISAMCKLCDCGRHQINKRVRHRADRGFPSNGHWGHWGDRRCWCGDWTLEC